MTSEREQAKDFVQQLKEQLGDGLACAVLYGSAARGDYRPGASDLNLLVIVAGLDEPELRAVAGPTRKWMEKGNPPPLLLTAAEWRTSADVFPIEYSDIREAHVLLAGEDPFEGIRIDRKHLRLQLEHELRSKKIQLREGLIAAGDSDERIGLLLVRSLSTFLALFRGMLRLAGTPGPAAAKELIDSAAHKVGFVAAPLLEVRQAKERSAEKKPILGSATAAGYLQAVERAARWLDEYAPGEGDPAEV